MKKYPGKKIWYVIKIEKFKSSLVDTDFERIFIALIKVT